MPISNQEFSEIIERVRLANVLRGPYKDMSRAERAEIYKFPSYNMDSFELSHKDNGYIFTVKLNENAHEFAQKLSENIPKEWFDKEHMTLALHFNSDSLDQLKSLMQQLEENYSDFDKIKAQFFEEVIESIKYTQSASKTTPLLKWDLKTRDKFSFDPQPTGVFLKATATTQIKRHMKDGKPYFVYTATSLHADEDKSDKLSEDLLSMSLETDAVIQKCLSEICSHFAKVVHVDNPDYPVQYITEGGIGLKTYLADKTIQSQEKDIDIMYQIAEVLYEMSYYAMFHGQISPSKISLTPEYKVLLSEAKPYKMLSTSTGADSHTKYYYCPPIHLLYHANPIPLSVEDDIYALGVMINEIFAKTRPYREHRAHDTSDEQRSLCTARMVGLAYNTATTMRPKIFNDAPSVLKYIIEGCWRHNPEDRFTMETVFQCLKYVKECNNDESKMGELREQLQEESDNYLIRTTDERIGLARQAAKNEAQYEEFRARVEKSNEIIRAREAARQSNIPGGLLRATEIKIKKEQERIKEAKGKPQIIEEQFGKDWCNDCSANFCVPLNPTFAPLARYISYKALSSESVIDYFRLYGYEDNEYMFTVKLSENPQTLALGRDFAKNIGDGVIFDEEKMLLRLRFNLKSVNKFKHLMGKLAKESTDFEKISGLFSQHVMPIIEINQRNMLRHDDSLELNKTNAEKLEEINYRETEEMQRFCCSISAEVMTNPVYVKGLPQYKFELSELQRWLKLNSTHPYTRNRVKHEDIVLDTTLKQEIDTLVNHAISNCKHDDLLTQVVRNDSTVLNTGSKLKRNRDVSVYDSQDKFPDQATIVSECIDIINNASTEASKDAFELACEKLNQLQCDHAVKKHFQTQLVAATIIECTDKKVIHAFFSAYNYTKNNTPRVPFYFFKFSDLSLRDADNVSTTILNLGSNDIHIKEAFKGAYGEKLSNLFDLCDESELKSAIKELLSANNNDVNQPSNVNSP